LISALFPEAKTMIEPVSTPDDHWTDDTRSSGKSSLVWLIQPSLRKNSRRSVRTTRPIPFP
jgi:hypothetical protein